MSYGTGELSATPGNVAHWRRSAVKHMDTKTGPWVLALCDALEEARERIGVLEAGECAGCDWMDKGQALDGLLERTGVDAADDVEDAIDDLEERLRDAEADRDALKGALKLALDGAIAAEADRDALAAHLALSNEGCECASDRGGAE